ncbi:JmjC domain-containing protein [Streptomyces sp. NPDC101150]|uniref:JmjC domain-containing protein n=1 Tax=Streptomyces sp. NPDC101150 TaxID=3366114 RepID=UPI003818CB3F
MSTAADCQEDRFTTEMFFNHYWRKKPLFVKGGMSEFLGRLWSDADFDAALAQARAQGGGAIKERPGEVVFIEEVSRFDADLIERAAAFSRLFGSPQAWFDSVQTYSSDGIGAHFDHSDNFVLQQYGVKEWSLASPHHIDPATIALRMMNTPGVGAHPMPDRDAIDFVVEPGDMLYIPLNWIHRGTSRGESLSLSLVCPALSLYSAVLPLLMQSARSQALGHQPIPAFHAGLSPEQRAEAESALQRATETLLSHLTSEPMAASIHKLQVERFFART